LSSSYVALPPIRTGEVDPNASGNIGNARAAGIPYVDVYMFPCPKCGNPSGQVKDMGKWTVKGIAQRSPKAFSVFLTSTVIAITQLVDMHIRKNLSSRHYVYMLANTLEATALGTVKVVGVALHGWKSQP